MPDDNRRRQALDVVSDEFHHSGLSVNLLHLAGAAAKGHGAAGALAALADWALPEAAEVELQALVGTLHGETRSTKHEARN